MRRGGRTGAIPGRAGVATDGGRSRYPPCGPAAVIGAVLTMRGNESVVRLLIASAVAFGWVVFILLAREAALMIADPSDASVRIAQAMEKPLGERPTPEST